MNTMLRTTRMRGLFRTGGAALILAAALTAACTSEEPETMQGVDGMEGMDGMSDMESTSAMQEDTGGMAGMDMGSSDGSIRLSPTAAGSFGVTFGMAERTSLVRTVRAVGTVEFDETAMAVVSPRFGGWAEELHLDFVGQRVRAGEPLLEVYSPELVSAQEELLLAERMMRSVGDSRVEGVSAGAEELLASARRRLDHWQISESQIDRLLETGEVRRTLTLLAPASGVVMEKRIVEGQAFTPGSTLYMIGDLSSIWVEADIFESDVGLIREGMPAEVTIAAMPGRTRTGRVQYVYPMLEDRTRSMRARVQLSNSDGALKPGMYATVRFTADLGETLTVPGTAVLQTGERAVVFVDMGGGSLMPHEVVLGIRGDRRVQILSGLEAGQRVVTSAQFLLDSESNLAEVMRAMMAQMDPSALGAMEMEGMDMGGTEPGGSEMQMTPDSSGGR